MAEGTLVDCTGAGININVNGGVSVESMETIFVNQRGDTMHGNLNMNNHKIINIPLPSESLEVVNKEYVDKVSDNIFKLVDRYKGTLTKSLDETSLKIMDKINTVYNSLSEKMKDASNIEKGVLSLKRLPLQLGKIKFSYISTTLLNMKFGTIKNVGNPQNNHDAVNLQYIKALPQIKYVELNLPPIIGKNINMYEKNTYYRINIDETTSTGKLTKKLLEKATPKKIIIISTARKSGNIWYYHSLGDIQSDDFGLTFQNASNITGPIQICYVELVNQLQERMIPIDRTTYDMLA